MAFMKLSQNAKDAFELVRKGKMRGATFHIINDGEVDVEHLIDFQNDISFEDEWHTSIEKYLPQEACRFLVFQLDYLSSCDKVQRSKMIFLSWAPTKASQKEKMLTAFCTQSIVHQFGGSVGCRSQAGNLKELDYQTVKEKMLRTSTVK
eukprot:CAMPEP_0201550162 /NCGR_PEP_ID=MMETSP0173_2-20130828/6561_1 /ASSEMBLY_ACC=CAM_ASM_000268 /TAXON_ID=218659 /ORGANISM="Vexillifera sp., Strain DIVA3 564/2" /LENGTH=148 /DNA_ID=CAMNT_0047960067 /DNA_START=107 /DNA_END=553 /DNA_ORIENTATION=+